MGRRELDHKGRCLAAVLACGDGAGLSHEAAGTLWELCRSDRIEVSTLERGVRRLKGVTIHRRAKLEVTRRDNISVTTPVFTLIDLAGRLNRRELEVAINAADKGELINLETLRQELERHRGQRGISILRDLLDEQTLVLTDSELERLFVPIALRAGLGPPQTQIWLDGFRVDFFWPELELVVETDGLRYHRTPAEQERDRLRDQVHLTAGRWPLRFTHGQIKYRSEHVRETLVAVVRRIRK